MTTLFGDVPMTLINEGTRGKEFYSNTGKLLGVTIELSATGFVDLFVAYAQIVTK